MTRAGGFMGTGESGHAGANNCKFHPGQSSRLHRQDHDRTLAAEGEHTDRFF
jgi:hypothetical protein